MNHLHNNHPSSRKRLRYIIAPLFLLTACILSINILNWWVQRAFTTTPIAVGGTTAASKPDQTIVMPTQTAVAITPSTTTPTPTPFAPPEFPAGTTIQLLGPPANSQFAQLESITLYWKWPLPLTDDQFFAIYLLNEIESQQIGIVEETNLGTQFQWQMHLDTFPLEQGTIQWQVQLFSKYADQPLISSESRILTFR
ncbi:MAG: hypothetical protein KC419_25320 [Anaerolineales bacterium]|nr:hypothetical protein [Anaerolineales bacterium]MCA9931839.1 hypothetical protein [Anaerolineales bacterium]